MRRALVLFPLLLATFPNFAQQADLSLAADVVGIPHYELRTEIAIVVTNAGPDVATNVTVTSTNAMEGELDPRCTRLAGDIQFRCTSSVPLAPGQSLTFRGQTGSHGVIQPLVYPLEVRADQPDPNLANNSATVSFRYVDRSGGDVSVTPPATLDAQRIGTARIGFTNRTQYGSRPVYLTFWVSNLERLVSSDPALGCSVLPPGSPGGFSTITCITPLVPAFSSVEYAFELQFSRETRIAFSVNAGWADFTFNDYDERTYTRPFVVTHTGDAGPGSLRQALLDANAYCSDDVTACSIEFAMAEAPSAGGWHVIHPQTALPVVTANWIVVDGETQTRRADSNVLGPEILLDGSAAGQGSGLTFHGMKAAVYGLAIGGFERHGIYAQGGTEPVRYGGQYDFSRNFIGIDPTGTRALSNGSRGLMIGSGRAVIEDNILSGNVRSGLFFEGLTATIRRNRIGVAADGLTPVGNGASGIFMASHARGTADAAVVDNVIAFNGHVGIGMAADAGAVIGPNRIVSNVQGGIDIRLDGPTLDFPQGGTPAVPATPVITSARVEGTSTIIEGYGFTGVNSGSGYATATTAVDLYANTELDWLGFAEGEHYLGRALVGADRKFFFRFEGNLRGFWITGVGQQRATFWGGEWTENASSEFTRPLKVE